MTPEKTGAVCFLEQYGVYVRGDFYDMKLFGILRVTNASRTREKPDVVHYRIGNVMQWWDQEAHYGTLMTDSWQYHGYEGEAT